MMFSSSLMASNFFCALLFFLVRLQVSLSAAKEGNLLESVPDLEKSMYMTLDGFPCVRLLSLSGEIGCSNPGREKVVAPIVRFKNSDKLTRLSTLLVSQDELDSFLSRVSTDSVFAKNVGGVLVESRAQIQDELKGFSPDKKFPQAAFSPYQNLSYQWNPHGSGIMWRNHSFPVFLLSESGILAVKEAAIKNEESKKAYTSDVAEFDLVMQTTKAGTRDSESCLKAGTCIPLGGYSVWSALPPINISSTESSKRIVLTVASMDSASFFRDKTLGADSPISGLVALLAAIDALSRIEGLNDLNKQLAFVVFTGEAWGYLGSRRFLRELDQHSDAVKGLNSTSIDMVLEVGSVGKGFSQGKANFYAHTTKVSATTNETLDALRIAEDSLVSSGIKIMTANASNPGIPPSSLMSFLGMNSHTSGVVLEDFDAAFSNQFYHSHLDDISNINMSSIKAAASVVARTLYVLASDKKDLNHTALDAINVNASLVEELVGCLLNCEPGLSCGLVRHYISPSSTCPSHYVGVLLGEPSSTPYTGYVGDVPRFLWNFLADITSSPLENDGYSCPKNCSNAGQMCIQSEVDGKGICVASTTRYVPAYSTRLKFEADSWKVLPVDSSDPMGMVDPVWTESNWDKIGLRVYTVHETTYDHLVLLSGLAITILAYIAIAITKTFIAKALKRD